MSQVKLPKKYQKAGSAAFDSVQEAKRFSDMMQSEYGCTFKVQVDKKLGTAIVMPVDGKKKPEPVLDTRYAKYFKKYTLCSADRQFLLAHMDYLNKDSNQTDILRCTEYTADQILLAAEDEECDTTAAKMQYGICFLLDEIEEGLKIPVVASVYQDNKTNDILLLVKRSVMTDTDGKPIKEQDEIYTNKNQYGIVQEIDWSWSRRKNGFIVSHGILIKQEDKRLVRLLPDEEAVLIKHTMWNPLDRKKTRNALKLQKQKVRLNSGRNRIEQLWHRLEQMTDTPPMD